MSYGENNKDYKIVKYLNCWPAKVSALFFVVFMYILIKDTFIETLKYHPELYNFFIATIILSLSIVLWKRPKRFHGCYFILIGIIYFFVAWNRALATSVIANSIWLILTGVLFFVSPFKEKVVMFKPKKRWRQRIVTRVNRYL